MRVPLLPLLPTALASSWEGQSPLVCPAPFLTVIVTVVPGGGRVHWALRVLSLLMVEGERGG